MFRSKTVFILGAGASQEVGLPTGNILKKRIADNINIKFDDLIVSRQVSGDPQIIKALCQHTRLPNNMPGDLNPYVKAAHHLRNALPLAISIDNLLDAHRYEEKIITCGKLGIVSSILEAERSSKLYYNSNEQQNINFDNLDGTWFTEFIKILTENIDKNQVNSIFDNVTILSFNYDRCIEHHLHEALQVYYNLDRNTAASLMKEMKIFHPYGSVGKLPWQISNSLQVPFGVQNCDILNLSKQIKTFTEKIHEPAELDEIRNSIQQAETIVFLGFAFHGQNLELITPNISCKAKRIYATAHGISKSDCGVIHSALENILMQKQGKASIELRDDLMCAGLFKEYWRSLSPK